MDSKLDSIFRTTFHPAEKTDSWMGIRRQDPQDDRQGKGRKDKEDEAEFGEDSTTLSVTALHSFLRSLQQQESPLSGEADIPAPPPHSTDSTPPEYRAAASAYRSASHAGGRPYLSLADTKPAISAPTVVLSDDEQRIVRQLLKDVETLARRGVQTIRLHSGTTLLQGLALGIEDALDMSVEP